VLPRASLASYRNRTALVCNSVAWPFPGNSLYVLVEYSELILMNLQWMTSHVYCVLIHFNYISTHISGVAVVPGGCQNGSMNKQMPQGTLAIRAEDVFGDRRLDIRDVAELLGVRISTVRQWIRDGDLRALRLGRSYQVWASAVREFKELRDQEQRSDQEQRRRAKQLRVRLQYLQEREPEQQWMLVDCIACGSEGVLSTVYHRTDGNAFCSACRDRGISISQLDKSAWARKVKVLVEERNRQDAFGGWIVDYCAICGKPYDWATGSYLTGGIYPSCDHAEPFHGHSDAETCGGYDDRIVLYVARRTIAWHNGKLSDEAHPNNRWVMSICAHCGEPRAASSREKRLIGDTVCLVCLLNNTDTDPSHRATAVAQSFRKLTTGRCSCGSEREVAVQQGTRLVLYLSWCGCRPVALRRSLAEAHAQSAHLSDPLKLQLIEAVTARETAIESDNLDNVPF
jgi:excisionase family DNA binding protein